MPNTKTVLLGMRVLPPEAERLRRLAAEVGRPVSVLLRYSVRQLRRESLPPHWLDGAEVERAVGSRAPVAAETGT